MSRIAVCALYNMWKISNSRRSATVRHSTQMISTCNVLLYRLRYGIKYIDVSIILSVVCRPGPIVRRSRIKGLTFLFIYTHNKKKKRNIYIYKCVCIFSFFILYHRYGRLFLIFFFFFLCGTRHTSRRVVVPTTRHYCRLEIRATDIPAQQYARPPLAE